MTRPAAGAPWPTGSTRLVVLLGWPARYSLSPPIHNAAFAEQGLDLVYVVLPVPDGRLDEVLAALALAGVVGANVTVPHKLAALAACDELTDEARLVGAVNTLHWTDAGLVGDNTDAVGLQDTLREDVGIADGEPVVLLGTGGAARAAAVAVGRLAAEVTVVGRRPGACASLAELATHAGASTATSVPLAEPARVDAAVAAARVVVNATTLGMAGEDLPSPFLRLRPGQVAYDLIYEPPETPFLRAAREAGVEGHNGLGMLVGQAAASYRRWTGREAPLTTMSAAATGALVARHRDEVAAALDAAEDGHDRSVDPRHVPGA